MYKDFLTLTVLGKDVHRNCNIRSRPTFRHNLLMNLSISVWDRCAAMFLNLIETTSGDAMVDAAGLFIEGVLKLGFLTFRIIAICDLGQRLAIICT